MKNLTNKIFYCKIVFTTILLLLVSLLLCSVVNAQREEAKRPAWSGYWWPYIYGGLATGNDYRNHPAPLEKYELLVDGYLSGRVVDSYLNQFYDPSAPTWFGLCYAWASASIVEDEPSRPSVHDNILFRVGDKKGLYTLAHTADKKNRSDGSMPHIFHQWLVNVIGVQHELFYADLDPSDEVWAFPIYAYDLVMGVRVADIQPVTVVIEYASDFVPQDYVGTEVRTKEYTYSLIYSGETIIDSEWTGASISDHPQTLSIVTEQESYVDNLDYALVKEIGTSIDDEWESLEGNYLPPGSYELVCLNEDKYLVTAAPNEKIDIIFSNFEGSSQALTLQVRDLSGTVLNEVVVDSVTRKYELELSGLVDSQYLLVVSQSSYTDANFYSLTVSRHEFEHHVLLPYIPNNGWWNGLSLTNTDNTGASNFTLTSIDSDGNALQSHLVNQQLEACGKRLELFASLDMRLHERSERESLVVYAPEKVKVVNLFGGAEKGLGGFFSENDHVTAQLSLPYSSGVGTIQWGSVVNRSSVTQSVECVVYRSDGVLVATEQVELLSHEKLSLNAILSVRDLPQGGWIELLAQSGDDCLSAYQVHRSLTNSTKIEAIRALALAQKMWLPHYEPRGIWSTELILVNPQPESLSITLSLTGQLTTSGEPVSAVVELLPHEKRIVRLADYFPQSADLLLDCGVECASSSGFYGYVDYATTEDFASIPLLTQNQFSNELCLPHLSFSYGWWTGVVLFNPQPYPVSLSVVPVDVNGTTLVDSTLFISLEAGEKQGFSVADSWPMELVNQFSHIEFNVYGEDQIGGLFLFGRYGARQLAGSVLPLRE